MYKSITRPDVALPHAVPSLPFQDLPPFGAGHEALRVRLRKNSGSGSAHPWLAALVTSLTVMRPPAPEPSTWERSTPSSCAFCLAASVASGSS